MFCVLIPFAVIWIVASLQMNISKAMIPLGRDDLLKAHQGQRLKVKAYHGQDAQASKPSRCSSSCLKLIGCGSSIKGRLEEVKASLEIKEGIKCILSLFL